jgi:O-antigen ligase
MLSPAEAQRMTAAVLAPPEGGLRGAVEQPPLTSRRRRLDRSALEWVAAASVLLTWAVHVLPARGGWSPYVVPVAGLLALPALVVLRPWRHCPPWLLALAGAPAVGAVVVAVAAPFGDGGPVSLSRWGYAGLLLLTAAAFARTPTRRQAVVVVVLLTGLLQYSQAWLPWWGAGGERAMVGTLYSANPFGGLMLALALLAAGVGVLSPPRLRRLGWVVAPLAGCGVVLSGARSAVLLLVGGWLLLAAVAARLSGRGALLRLGATVVATWLVLGATTGQLPGLSAQTTLDTTGKQASGQTLDSTTQLRLDFWRAAWAAFTDQPLVGGGSGSYAGASRAAMAPAAERSPFAHNEPLGALAEGGLALGVPVIALLAGALVLFAARLASGLLAPQRARPEELAAALGGGALVGHGLLDITLVFPAVLGLVVLLLAVCLPVADGPAPAAPGRARVGLCAAVVAALALCACYVGASHDRAGVSGTANAAGSTAPLPPLSDARLVLARADALLADGDTGPEPLLESSQELALLARVDPGVDVRRVELLADAGQGRAATALARELAQRHGGVAPLLVVPYAERLAAEGEQPARRRPADPHRRVAGAGVGRVRRQLVPLLLRAEQMGGRTATGWGCAWHHLRAAEPESTLALPSPQPRHDTETCAAWSAAAPIRTGSPS